MEVSGLEQHVTNRNISTAFTQHDSSFSTGKTEISYRCLLWRPLIGQREAPSLHLPSMMWRYDGSIKRSDASPCCGKPLNQKHNPCFCVCFLLLLLHSNQLHWSGEKRTKASRAEANWTITVKWKERQGSWRGQTLETQTVTIDSMIRRLSVQPSTSAVCPLKCRWAVESRRCVRGNNDFQIRI